MYVCVRLCTFVYVCVLVYVCVFVYVCVRLCMPVYGSVSLFFHVHMHVPASLFVFVSECVVISTVSPR